MLPSNMVRLFFPSMTFISIFNYNCLTAYKYKLKWESDQCFTDAEKYLQSVKEEKKRGQSKGYERNSIQQNQY